MDFKWFNLKKKKNSDDSGGSGEMLKIQKLQN